MLGLPVLTRGSTPDGRLVEALPIDEHFDRRLEAILDEAEKSGGYVEAGKEEFNAVEREALEILRNRKSR